MKLKKIRSKLIMGFLIITIILAVVSGMIFYQLNVMHNELREMIEVEFELFSINQEIALNVAERSSHIRGYVMSGNEEYLDKFNKLTIKNNDLFERLSTISSGEEARVLFHRIREWENTAINAIVSTYQRGGYEAASNIMLNSNFSTDGEYAIHETQNLANNREENLRRINNDLMRQQQEIAFILLGATVLGIIVSILLGTLICNIITKPINNLLKTVNKIAEGDLTQEVITNTVDEIGQLGQAVNKMIISLKNLIGSTMTIGEEVRETSRQLAVSSQEIAVASEEVTTTITDVAKSVVEQTTSIEKSTETISNISNNMDIVAENVNNINKATKITLISAEEGIMDAKNAVDKMNNIQKTTKNASNIILKLNDDSKEIEKIVDTIGSIAEQTNLLSLNAAIEAARAGESGKGFAVVADEIRKLAEQSANSTLQITKLISGIQAQIQDAVSSMDLNNNEVELGVEIVSGSSKKFQKILNEIDNVVQKVETVNESTSKVAGNIEGIVEDFEAIAAIAQDTSASSEEVSASSQEQTATIQEIADLISNLADGAEQLRSSIKTFKL